MLRTNTGCRPPACVKRVQKKQHLPFYGARIFLFPFFKPAPREAPRRSLEKTLFRPHVNTYLMKTLGRLPLQRKDIDS